jgi:hypothetical protein
MTHLDPDVVERAAEAMYVAHAKNGNRPLVPFATLRNDSKDWYRSLVRAALASAIPEAVKNEKASVAGWMLEHSYPTGHGDTVADLLVELVGHERGACAKIARDGCLVPPDGGSPTEEEADMCDRIATLILARSAEKKGEGK